MGNINIFQYAAKNKLRFPYKGLIAVEDLYQLSIEALNSVYQTLKQEEKDAEEDSLLETENVNEELEVKIAIVKAIFDEKKAEANKRKKAAETRAKRQRILEMMAKKDDEAMANASKEELQAMLDALDEE